VRTVLLLFAIILFISCEKQKPIKAGTVQGLTYENRSLGFGIDLPEKWSIISDQETYKLINKKIASEQELERRWESSLAKPLVAAYRYRDHQDTAAVINPNILVTTEFLPSRANILSAYDYIPHYKKSLDAHENVTYEYLDDRSAKIGEFQFEVVEVTYKHMGFNIHKRSFLYKHTDQLINITITWEESDQDSYLKMWQSFLSSRLAIVR
jgi:hypothetical protein